VPYPLNQQAIWVIREEVDRIEWALTDVIPRWAHAKSSNKPEMAASSTGNMPTIIKV
jgi:hypothetical protein